MFEIHVFEIICLILYKFCQNELERTHIPCVRYLFMNTALIYTCLPIYENLIVFSLQYFVKYVQEKCNAELTEMYFEVFNCGKIT